MHGHAPSLGSQTNAFFLFYFVFFFCFFFNFVLTQELVQVSRCGTRAPRLPRAPQKWACVCIPPAGALDTASLSLVVLSPFPVNYIFAGLVSLRFLGTRVYKEMRSI